MTITPPVYLRGALLSIPYTLLHPYCVFCSFVPSNPIYRNIIIVLCTHICKMWKANISEEELL